MAAQKDYSTPQIESEIILKEISTPSDSESGYQKLYSKSDGLYIKDGSTESKLATLSDVSSTAISLAIALS
jgi:topoisomerase IA-like protein